MVAICSTTAFRNFTGILSPSTGTPRQSSLRSITSTHSSQSLIKEDKYAKSDSSYSRRRVHFADCDDSSDTHDTDLVFEFDVVDPVEPLYLTAAEILKIRSDARHEASHFAQVYPKVIAEMNFAFENGGNTLNPSSQIKKLRSCRRRLDPYDVALESIDRDVDVFMNTHTEYADDDVSDQQDWDSEDTLDERYYFCTMRGLESRISPLFRLNRRMTIRNVINLQTEMKKSRCCPAQTQMGLRAVYTQASQKSRSFAFYQAALDEYEVYTMLK